MCVWCMWPAPTQKLRFFLYLVSNGLLASWLQRGRRIGEKFERTCSFLLPLPMPFSDYDMSKSIASPGRMPRFRKRWAQCYIQPRKRGSYADDWLHVKCTGKRAKTKDRTLLSSPAWVRTWWDSISGHFLFCFHYCHSLYLESKCLKAMHLSPIIGSIDVYFPSIKHMDERVRYGERERESFEPISGWWSGCFEWHL